MKVTGSVKLSKLTSFFDFGLLEKHLKISAHFTPPDCNDCFTDTLQIKWQLD